MSTGDPPSYWEAYFQHIMPKTYSTQTMTTTPAPTSGYVALICEHCEGNHFSERCPYIKAIEYDDAGKVRRIEFYPRPVKLPPPVVTISGGFSSDTTVHTATWNPNALRTYGLG
jgi:hypothetical protein